MILTEVENPDLRYLGVYYTRYGSDEELFSKIETVVLKYRIFRITNDQQLHQCSVELSEIMDSIGLVHLHPASRLMAYYITFNLPFLEKFEKNHQLVIDRNLVPKDLKVDYHFYFSMWLKWRNMNFDFIDRYIDLNIRPQKNINDYDKSKLKVNDIVANSINPWFESFEKSQQFGIMKLLIANEYMGKVFFKEFLSSRHIQERMESVNSHLADVIGKNELIKSEKNLNIKLSDAKLKQVNALINDISTIEEEFSYRLNNSKSLTLDDLISELQEMQKLFNADHMFIRKLTLDFIGKISKLPGIELLTAADLSWFLYHLLLINHSDVLTGLGLLRRMADFKNPRDLKKYMQDEIEGKFKIKIKKSGVEIFQPPQNTPPQ